MTLTSLYGHVIGRNTSLFEEDLDASDELLRATIAGSRILLIGGGGSIGFQTLRTLLRYEPASVHVVDHNENALAELVRTLRSSANPFRVAELTTLPFDFGGSPFRLWFEAEQTAFDHVLNFAALKHVRSEKDPFSTLAMLETNVVHLDRLARLFACRRRTPDRVFSVSTDKAANPSSMMGATKRLMEHALFAPTDRWPDGVALSSARFANVAFSNGSLLQSWQKRLQQSQPLACPENCRRFFVTLDESGHLCTLAGFAGRHGTISIPALDPNEHLVLLSDVIVRFLQFHGLEPRFVRDEQEATARAAEAGRGAQWPVLLTPLDTAGEKPYEEFVGAGEVAEASRCAALREIEYRPPQQGGSYARLVAAVRAMLDGESPRPVSNRALHQLIAEVEPAFLDTYRASEKSLDQRM